MNATPPRDEPDASYDDLLQLFAEMLSGGPAGMGPHHVPGAFGGAAGPTDVWGMPLEPLKLAPPPQSPLRYTLKVSLDNSKPPIWRRITVPSDLTLDVFHEVLQAAMGWTNSHLHNFAPGNERRGSRTESILSEFDLAEGEAGTPESGLQLDALLSQLRDRLFYWYDFGDDWHHTILLEKLETREENDRECACIKGRRACPPEDFGGIHIYNMMMGTAADEDDPEHDWVEEQMAEMGLTPGDAAEFDLVAHDDAVRRAARGEESLQQLLADPTALPTTITDLFDGIGHEAARWVAGFVDAAPLDDPVGVAPDEARAATAVIRTVLDHVGDEGVSLTAAGYLKPATVRLLMAELDPERRWRGASTESNARPLLDAREIITRLGLLRKQHGKLLLTKAGATLRADPVALWWHVARRLPVEKPAEGRSAAVFLLLRLAAGTPVDDPLKADLEEFMTTLGWELGGYGVYSSRDAWWYLIDRTRDVLSWATTGRLFTPHNADAALDASASRLMARAALTSEAAH